VPTAPLIPSASPTTTTTTVKPLTTRPRTGRTGTTPPSDSPARIVPARGWRVHGLHRRIAGRQFAPRPSTEEAPPGALAAAAAALV